MQSKLTRRKFIKLSGVAALSAGSGFGLGKLIDNNDYNRYAFYGYLPDDRTIISKAIQLFVKSLNNKSVSTDFLQINERELNPGFRKTFTTHAIFTNQSVSISLKRIGSGFDSDLLITDSKKPIYSIENDFSNDLLAFRNLIKGTKSSYYFAAEFVKTNFVSSLLNSGSTELIIENERGLFDKIGGDRKYKKVLINGPQGKTTLEADKGRVRIVGSTCRNKICEKMGSVYNPGEVLACVPNKILVRITNT